MNMFDFIVHWFTTSSMQREQWPFTQRHKGRCQLGNMNLQPKSPLYKDSLYKELEPLSNDWRTSISLCPTSILHLSMKGIYKCVNLINSQVWFLKINERSGMINGEKVIALEGKGQTNLGKITGFFERGRGGAVSAMTTSTGTLPLSRFKHRKNCECCPVPQLIVR